MLRGCTQELDYQETSPGVTCCNKDPFASTPKAAAPPEPVNVLPEPSLEAKLEPVVEKVVPESLPLTNLAPELDPTRELKEEAAQFDGYISDSSDVMNFIGALKPNVKPDAFAETSGLTGLMPSFDSMQETIIEATTFLAQDIGIGMGPAMLVISAGLSLTLLPFRLKMQLQALKMRMLAPELKVLQDKSADLQKKGNYAKMKEVNKERKELMAKYGIRTWVNLVGLLQIPPMILWFFSIRHICMNPHLYPEVTSQGFLWFKNLSEFDPFYILPMLSCSLSMFNIAVSDLIDSERSESDILERGHRPVQKADLFPAVHAVFLLPDLHVLPSRHEHVLGVHSLLQLGDAAVVAVGHVQEIPQRRRLPAGHDEPKAGRKTSRTGG